MSRIYDNWERLVGAVLRKEEDWRLCHAPSITTRASSSFSSLPAHSNFGSGHFSDVDFENLKHEQIYVNSKPINSRELTILQTCPNPPTNLKPGGNYWYDKHAGFWGKQGYKPCQIISANLNVGGYIESNASYGNTSVSINGREITKMELRMLKLVGVKCPRTTHFWMKEDSSYQEESGTPIRGSIWNKARMKLICSLLSLPFPYTLKSSHASGDYIKQEKLYKIILIGCNGLETISFFKQAIDILRPNYQLITARNENFEDNYDCREMFEDAKMVVFSLSLTDYNQIAVDEHGTYVNKMMSNKKLFENVATHLSLHETPILLLLENYDLFAQDIEQNPLNQCDWFREFHPIDADNVIGNLGEIALHYICVQFEILSACMTGPKVYVKKVNGLDQGSVNETLNCVEELLKWDQGMNTILSF